MKNFKLKYYIYVLLAKVLSPFIKYEYINIYKEGRRVGNTTRLIDMFVQDFFNKGKCDIFDHFNTRESRVRVFNLVLERLNREHYIKREDVRLDRNRLIIIKRK